MHLPLSLALLASTAIAAELRPLHVLQARQLGECATGDVACGIGCIPIGYECCADVGGIGGCEPGTYCTGTGCCPEGVTCTGYGGVDFEAGETETTTIHITTTDIVINTLTESESEETTTTVTDTTITATATMSTTTSSRPIIPMTEPTESATETPGQAPSDSTPTSPEFTGGQESLRPAVGGLGALVGLVAGAVLL
jgi:hypothetical protein